MRYRWEYHDNPHVATLHLSCRLPWSWIHEGEFAGREALDEEDAGFLMSLVTIAGVQRISSDGYELDIEKGAVFGWDEIRPAVLEIVRQRYSPNSAMIEA